MSRPKAVYFFKLLAAVFKFKAKKVKYTACVFTILFVRHVVSLIKM